MKRVKFGYIFISALLLLAACGGPKVICHKPYILVGDECCLDSNNNTMCDADEVRNVSCPKLDCTLCPATVVEKNVTVTVTKYVCKNGSVVDEPAMCAGNEAHNPFKGYTPYTGAEARASYLDLFELRPACRDSQHAIEFHYKVNLLPDKMTVQVKESPQESWRDIYTIDLPKEKEKYFYGALCADACTSNADFFLAPGKLYLVRVRLDYDSYGEKAQQTNEYFIDAREDGAYLAKLC